MAPENWPDLTKVLHAIQKNVGSLEDKESQNKLLLSFLEPKYTQGLDETDKAEKLAKFRKKVGSIVTNKGIRRTKTIQVEKIIPLEKFGIYDLFTKGPKAVFTGKYLEDQGFEVDEEPEEEAEEEGEAEEESPAQPGQKRKFDHSPEDTIQANEGKKQRFEDAFTPTTPEDNDSHTPTLVDRSVPRNTTSFPTSPLPRRSGPQPQEHDYGRVHASADKDQTAIAKGWAAQAGLRKTPEILPSRQPVNPAEIMVASTQGWLASHMQRIETALWHAMLSCFQDANIDAEAKSKFVVNPDDKLRGLYERLSGDPRWEIWTVKVENNSMFRQDYTFLGLLGAGIYNEVFGETLPWDVTQKVPNALGRDMQYFEQVVMDLGHDPGQVLKYIAGKQIADPEFQQTEVASHAQRLAGGLFLSLQPHLKNLTKRGGEQASGERLPYTDWNDYLETAFQEAIIIRHTLLVSTLAPFISKWPKAGGSIGNNEHRCQSETPGRDRILHPILFGIARKPRGESIVLSKALVVPADPSSSAGRQACPVEFDSNNQNQRDGGMGGIDQQMET